MCENCDKYLDAIPEGEPVMQVSWVKAPEDRLEVTLVMRDDPRAQLSSTAILTLIDDLRKMVLDRALMEHANEDSPLGEALRRIAVEKMLDDLGPRLN